MADRSTAMAELQDKALAHADASMAHAIRSIDRTLGTGFAQRHPELIAAYMNTVARGVANALDSSRLAALADARNRGSEDSARAA